MSHGLRLGFCSRWMLLASTILALASPIRASEGVHTEHPIRLKVATFLPLSGGQPNLPLPLRQHENGSDTAADYIVQFRDVIEEQWLTELKKLGAQILHYIPDYAFKVRMTPQICKYALELPSVVWIGPYHPRYKISPQLQAKDLALYRVVLTDIAVPQVVQSQIEALGARIVDQGGKSWAVLATWQQVDDLAHLLDVAWIEDITMPSLYNDAATGELRAPLVWSSGYEGSGQLVTIADTGIDRGVDNPAIVGDMHLDLDNRVAHISSWPIQPEWSPYVNNPGADDGASDRQSGHGTHVAGSVASNGALSEGRYKGVAPQAYLAVQAVEQYVDFNDQISYSDGYYLLGLPLDLKRLFQEAYDWGSRIHSNSWGISEQGKLGEYLAESQQADEFVWNHSDFIILVAAGNDGCDADGDGRVDNGSISAPATAKNVIAVGAGENLKPVPIPNPDSSTYGVWSPAAFPADPLRSDPMADAGTRGMAAMSSRGPTRDGRIAPTIIGPGTWIASTRSSMAAATGWGDPINSYYMYNGGTSMACPLVAGGIALVRQYYVQKEGITPSAALLKATLINSAMDIPGQYAPPYNEAGPVPNDDEGWGVANLQAAVLPRERRFEDGDVWLTTGQTLILNYQVESANEPFKVTLVWTDYPASLDAAVQLVNDLDLLVVSPSGQRYRGNVFAVGWSQTGGEFDRLNNVESVFVQRPEIGNYRIEIQGYNIPHGPQDFALVASGDFISVATPTPSATRTATRTPTSPRPSATPTSPPPDTGPITRIYQQGRQGYSGTSDTYLSAWSPNTNFGNQGDLLIRSSDTLAPLLRFDVSDIPLTATIKGAKLGLYMSSGAGNAMTAGAFQVLRPWSEAGATWREARVGEPWGMPGCNQPSLDRANDPLADQPLADAARWYEWDVAEAVRQWAATPEDNWGLVLKSDGPSVGQCSFASSEHWQMDIRPRLLVTFTLASIPKTLYLPLLLKAWPPLPGVPILEDIENSDGDGMYRISWSQAERATQYYLQESVSPSFVAPELIYQGEAREHWVWNKPPGTYYYRVRGWNSYGFGLWSQVKSVLVLPPTPTSTRTYTPTTTPTWTRTPTLTSTPTPSSTPTVTGTPMPTPTIHPLAGNWTGNLSFTIPPDRRSVCSLRLRFNILACGQSYWVTIEVLDPPCVAIADRRFSVQVRESMRALDISGTFIASDQAVGTFSYWGDIAGCCCPSASGSWTSIWQGP